METLRKVSQWCRDLVMDRGHPCQFWSWRSGVGHDNAGWNKHGCLCGYLGEAWMFPGATRMPAMLNGSLSPADTTPHFSTDISTSAALLFFLAKSRWAGCIGGSIPLCKGFLESFKNTSSQPYNDTFSFEINRWELHMHPSAISACSFHVHMILYLKPSHSIRAHSPHTHTPSYTHIDNAILYVLCTTHILTIIHIINYTCMHAAYGICNHKI